MGRITGSILRVLAALAIVLVVAAAALAWRLGAGPVSLAFLTPYLEEALNQGRDGEIGIRLGSTMLTWAGWDRTLDIRTRDVIIVDSEQTEVAELPEISIGLSGRALLRAELRPSSIDVLGAETVVIRRSDGSIGLGFGEASIQGGNNPILARLADELLVPPDAAPNSGSLSRISVLDSKLTLIDQVHGALWQASKVDLVVLRRGQSIVGDARLEIDFGGGRANAAGTVSYDSVSGNAKVGISFDDLYLPDLAQQGEVFVPFAGLELRLAGTLQFRVGSGGRFSDVAYSVSTSSGFLNFSDSFAERLPVVRATAHGILKWSTREAEIDELAIDLGGTLLTAQGVGVLPHSRTPKFVGEVRVLDLPLRRLPALWPLGVGGPARKWVALHAEDGRIIEANFKIGGLGESAAPADLGFTGDFTFSGMSVDYMEGLPPVTSALGRGRIAEDRLDIEIDTAYLNGVEISEAIVSLTGLSDPEQDASADFVLRGPLAKVIQVFDAPALGIVRDYGLPIEEMGGAVALRGQLTFPITEQGISIETANFAAAANLVDVSGSLPFAGMAFDRGTLTFRLDRNGFDVDGAVFVKDTPVTVRWRRDLGGENAASRYLLRTQIDGAGRKRFGFDTNGVIDGFVDVTIDAAVDRGNLKRAVIELNFLGAAIDLSTIHWRKSPNRPARARAIVFPQSDGSFIFDAIEFRADDLLAIGRLELDAENGVRRFDLSRLTVGRSDLSLSIRPRAPQGFIAALEGRRLDFSPYLGDFLNGGDSDLPPLELSLRVGEILIGQGEKLLNATGGGSYDGERWLDVNISGGFGVENKSLAFFIRTENGVRRVTLNSADAGSVAQAIGFTDNAVGGQLTLAAEIDDTKLGSPIVGRIQIRDFTLVKAPTLTRILTLASLQGILELLGGGDGISFVGLDMPFELKEGVLQIQEGRAFGPALGVTASGSFELDTDNSDFSGTLVPAYTVNSLLGNIPVLGNLLVGGEGEGIFALTYSVHGKADQADVQVNPLSALAPGFLRRFVTLLEARPARGAGDD